MEEGRPSCGHRARRKTGRNSDTFGNWLQKYGMLY